MRTHHRSCRSPFFSRAGLRRTTALFAAILLAFLPLFLLSLPVRAAKQTTLQLVKTTINRPEDETPYYQDSFNYSYEASELVHSTHYEKYYDGRLVEKADFIVTCSGPPASFRSGETISFTMTAEIKNHWYESEIHREYFATGGNIEKNDGFIACRVLAKSAPATGENIYSATDSGTLTIPDGSIYYRIVFHGAGSETIWEYEAVEDEPETAEETARPTRSGRRQDVVTEAAEKPGQDGGTSIFSDIFEDIDPGTAVGVGVGAIAVIGGGTAISRARKKKPKQPKQEKKKPEEPEEEPPREYRMYTYKDFGNAIARGAKPVYVYARIVTVTKGVESPSPEWTVKISPSGIGLNVRKAGMAGEWMAAEVVAPEEGKDVQGSVVFTLNGPGGVFRQEVIFRIVGKPYIVFPRDLEDGKWDIAADLSLVEMIAGACGQDKLRFAFADAAKEPVKIRFTGTDGFVITAEKDTRFAYTYWARIDNRTPPAARESGVFADKATRQITIEADFEDWGTVYGYFSIDLYPFGLSVLISGGPNPLRAKTPGVRQVLKDGRLEVLSYLTRDPNKLTLDPLIRPTGFDLCYTRLNDDGTALIGTEPKYFRLGKLSHTSEETKNILAKYRCPIGWHSAGFSFTPEDSLPEMKDEYVFFLPVTAAQDPSVNIRIPVRLLGEPFDPRAGWDKEFKELCVTAIRYFPGDVAHRYVQYIKTNLNDPDLWDASELRAMRYDMIKNAQDFWTRQYAYQMRLIDHYDATEAIFKKPMRFIGDTFFSIWAKYVFGNNEAWITPLKDLVVNIVDEAIWNYAYTGKTDIDFQEHIFTLATSALENQISIADDTGMGYVMSLQSKDTRKLAVVLALYLLVDWFSHYYQMNPRDFFESLRKTCLDTSVMAVKKCVGAGLAKAMNSEAVKNFFRNSFWDTINKNLPSQARISMTQLDKQGNEIITKRVVAGNLDKAIIQEGVGTVQMGSGARISPDQLITLEDARRLLGGPGITAEFFNNLKVDALLNYRGLVNAILESLFGQGIAMIYESFEADANQSSYGTFTFPIYWPSGKKEYIVVWPGKLFTSVTGLSSRAFGALYDALFGWYSVPAIGAPSEDIARELLK